MCGKLANLQISILFASNLDQASAQTTTVIAQCGFKPGAPN